jgi:hypothetical protein
MRDLAESRSTDDLFVPMPFDCFHLHAFGMGSKISRRGAGLPDVAAVKGHRICIEMMH